MLLLRWRRESTPAFRGLVHAADILWPALISVYATGQRSPFFLFFVFVLLAAAYRWGLWETMGTATAAVALLWGEGLLLHEGIHPVGVVLGDFVPKRLIMRSVSLVITGLFLGYLAEQQKQLRAEKAIIARVLAGVRVDLGLTGTVHAILRELLTTFGARRALLASQESNSLRVFVGRIEAVDGPAGQLTWLPPNPGDREAYLADSPADAFYALRRAKGSEQDFSIVALARDGSPQRDMPPAVVARLAAQHAFESVA
ncbi:MAG: hypothetical protein DMG68_09060, partial [Acidobacteria bacterium]